MLVVHDALVIGKKCRRRAQRHRDGRPTAWGWALFVGMLAFGLAAPQGMPAVLGQDGSAASTTELPNIVVFLVDDLGVMDASVPFLTTKDGTPKAYPLNAYYRTPNLEKLARRGIRFSQFYAMSVCSPTRISLMTGQNAARHGTTNWIHPDRNNGGKQGPPSWRWEGLSEKDVTLARVLRRAGYRTIHVGKGHFAPRRFPGADPRNLGFDVNIGGASFGSPGSYYGQQAYGLKTRRRSSAVPHLEKYHGTETFLTEALTREACREIRESVKGGRPFFLYFAHYAVHAPFQSDPRFAGHYASSKKSRRAQAFATLVEGVDKSLGDILAQIESLGVAENTLLFFLGDNGSDAPLGGPHEVACAAPLRGKKGSHYEGGMRVPFVAAWCRPSDKAKCQKRFPVAAGAIQQHPANVCDLFPTILEIVGQPLPKGHVIDGRSLRRLVAGQEDSDHSGRFLMHYPHAPHRSNYFTVYRKGNWKVVYHYFVPSNGVKSHYQLFHLGEDPFESHDRSADEPGVLREMMQEMVDELERLGARMPVDAQGQPVRPIVP